MRFGVVTFPGTCDDRDALTACSRVGEAVSLWHADADLRGVDAVVVPGGFSYGDYLRCGAIAAYIEATTFPVTSVLNPRSPDATAAGASLVPASGSGRQ